jgi:hypothetical protein
MLLPLDVSKGGYWGLIFYFGVAFGVAVGFGGGHERVRFV